MYKKKKKKTKTKQKSKNKTKEKEKKKERKIEERNNSQVLDETLLKKPRSHHILSSNGHGDDDKASLGRLRYALQVRPPHRGSPSPPIPLSRELLGEDFA